MFTVYQTGELFVPTRKPIRYSVNTWSDMWLSTLEIGVAQFLFVTESLRYAFRASAKAIYPVVNMAFVFVLKKRPLGEKK